MPVVCATLLAAKVVELYPKPGQVRRLEFKILKLPWLPSLLICLMFIAQQFETPTDVLGYWQRT